MVESIFFDPWIWIVVAIVIVILAVTIVGLIRWFLWDDDNLTNGLPKLPDDQFWRISKERPPHVSYKLFVLSIVQKVTRLETEAVYKKFFGFNLYSHNVTVEVAGEKVIRRTMLGLAPTPERILETAEWLIVDNQCDQEIETLIGDYPPKTLGEN